MENLIPLLVIPVLILALALLTNLYREHRHYSLELKPNCLLTRLPVVFITGPRSLFYFRKYWNAYPEILAEHGYEVFTVHLPWRGPERGQRMKKFLDHQEALHKKYHFICDSYTAKELGQLFEQSTAVSSLTVLKEHRPADTLSPQRGLFLALSYQLHSWSFRSVQIPPSEDLGVHRPTSSPWLLLQMQEKGEQDFLSSRI